MAVIDASALIGLQKGVHEIEAVISDLRDSGETLRVPAASWIEFLVGFDATERLRADRRLQDAFVFEPVDHAIVLRAAALQNALAREGRAVSWHDLQVACTALHYEEPLVTTDSGFDAIPGLARLP